MTKKEQNHQYRANNKDKIREYKRLYYEKNKDKIREYKCLYYEKNKDKLREKNRQYQIDNKDKIREYKRLYYSDNKDKFKEYKHLYYEKNKGKLKEEYHQYRKMNPEVTRRSSQRHRARKKKLPDTLTKDEWQNIVDQHFDRCHYCGKKTNDLHQEHKIPVSKGGGYTKDNIVPACKSCNSSKYLMNYKKFVKVSQKRSQLELF